MTKSNRKHPVMNKFTLTRRAASASITSIFALAWAGQSNAQARSREDTAFTRLAQRWIEGSLRLGPVAATQIGEHKYDGFIDDMSAEGRLQNMAFARLIRDQLDQIDSSKLTRDNQVDAAMLMNALNGQIWNVEISQDWAWNPLQYQSVAGGAVYNLMAREFAPLKTRLVNATSRMEKIPTLLRQARENLIPARVPKPHAETYSAQNKGLKSIIDEMIAPHKHALRGAQLRRLDAAIATYNRAIDEHQSWIDTTLLPAANADFRVGATKFDQQLGFTLMSNLSRQEIRARADAAIIRVRARMYEIASRVLTNRHDPDKLPPSPTDDQRQSAIRAALDIAAQQRPTPDKLVETASNATEIARQFVLQKDLITLPTGPVKIILMPEFQRGFAVAYCDSPGPLDKNLDTFYAVSPIPDGWSEEQTTSFLREYNMRGIMDIAVHEAMPGHYVQLFHANRHRSLLRAILGSGSFIEGWAVYAEQMMVEEGFKASDLLYELTQLKVQLRTICNAIIDQAIHVDGMTREEMMHLLTQTAFQEEREAAGKWRRAQLSYTQLSTYFVGFAEHIETRDLVKMRRGAGFNLKTYHDEILSFGSPPGKFARALILNEAIPA